ncbi:SGNH/GDSL hydrolase family protein [Hymenobacter jeollabukensis]|uniref:T9SS type A sorting domain-containing protein n=1 Tax=Hymenobacter jeollabukensis TaxID=2025313 RepID=A0A5R8WXA6_9BACT|nr:SGNH/GDSL hydrolase family protein [Hymenobacter jeollabukensis]TLM97170.1 T9SS type A sorting domain-containing protein [Hymenobacter jeollabukensis]
MRKPLLLLALGALTWGSARAQAVRSVLADFGPNDVTNGNITPSPDVNGNYWNNILNQTGVADTFRLVDKANAATGIKLKVGANFLTNGITTGGLLAPDPALLGQYAIATATQDYFFLQGTGATSVGSMRISGLNRSKRYVFHLFGSRVATAETRVTQYKLTGSSVNTLSLTTTGTNVGANGYAGNNNTLAHSDTLTADASGAIVLEVSKTTGMYAYLNLMRIDEVPGRTSTVNYAFQNTGFELGNLTSWTTAGNAAGATVNTATKHLGAYAAKLTGASLGLQQQISYRAAAGVTSYRLGGYFLNPSGTEALRGAQSAHLELLYYDQAMTLLGRFRSDSLVATSAPNAWVRLDAIGTIPANTAFVKAVAVWRNAAGAAGSVYFDDLELAPYTPQNPYKLTYIGSSGAYGTGATNQRGYTTLYAELLTRRSTAGQGAPWVTANVCVPGNNTVDVLGRFDRDVLPQNGKYVMIGLVLGNEGIITGGQATFNQFRTNMIQLINLARADGLVPIINNGYTRNDYTATQYTFTRQMNALIHGWNVPSVNLLGGVDDGNGRWAEGYWWDALHPNDRGHAELSYTIVPSLMDALNANKALPTRRVSNGIVLRNSATAPADIIRLTPEEVVHPFTTAIRFRATQAGRLVEVQDSAGLSAGTIRIASNGKVVYQSAKGNTINGTVTVTDNRWHKLVLTHYYARGATQLYVDSVREGNVPERLRPTRLDLGGNQAPARLQLRDWFFYRSGMNQDEIWALAADSLLKSSQELYAPLDGRRVVSTDSLTNLAQSLNTLTRVSSPLAVRESTQAALVSLFPNPTTGALLLQAPLRLEGVPVTVYDLAGRAVLTAPVRNGRLSVASLPAGLYTVTFQLNGEAIHKRLVKQDR